MSDPAPTHSPREEDAAPPTAQAPPAAAAAADANGTGELPAQPAAPASTSTAEAAAPAQAAAPTSAKPAIAVSNDSGELPDGGERSASTGSTATNGTAAAVTMQREGASSGHAAQADPPLVAGGGGGGGEEDEEEPSILPFVYLPASKVYLPLPWQCFAFVWLFLFTMFVLCMVLTATTWRYPDPATQLQLPDIALDILPLVPELEHVTDLLLATLEVMCFVTIGVLWLIKAGKMEPINKKLLDSFGRIDTIHMVPWIRFFVCFTAITALRIVVVGSTVLPSTDNHCKTRPDTGNFWWNSLVGVLSFGGSNVHCGDLLFSGHTAVITLSFMAVWQYSPIFTRWLRHVAAVVMVGTWFTILMSRSHYTDDIVIAFYMAVTLWILVPHESEHGAPALWQLFIQNPYGVYLKIQEATAERDARRSRAPVSVAY